MDQPAADQHASGGWPRRLDAAAAAVAGVSRRRAQRLIADGMVTLNGRVTAAGDKGKLIGEHDAVAVSDEVGRVVSEPDAALTVLAAGEGWVAIDKPAGAPVHPLREGETGTVLNAVAARYPEVQGVGRSGGEGGLKSGVVHRLDVETSGVLLVALDETRWQRFREAFAGHTTEKMYTAVVAGRPRDVGRADLRLAITRHKPARVEAIPPDPDHPRFAASRRCTLSWRTTKRLADATRLDVSLDTGFLHQIRATFAHLGHPVLGDPLYGYATPVNEQHVEDHVPPLIAPRLMLHASSLRLGEIEVQSPLPDSFTATVTRLKK
ncbi:MAG: RluA family pseudouridine synthase [Planctomycetota bacterium]